MMMDFVFDSEKSAANKAKHGIEFLEAQAIWLDDERLTMVAKSLDDEQRLAVVGKIGSKTWTAIVTWRDSAIRIISVRRAREKEEVNYENRRIR